MKGKLIRHMPYSFESLEITFKKNAVENKFFRNEDGSAHLAVILPGVGYTTLAPMLYYTANSLSQLGADVLALDYGSALRSHGGISPSVRNEILSEISQSDEYCFISQKL